jgi:hypothetical protein
LWAIATVAGEYSPHRHAEVNRNSSLQRTIFVAISLNILKDHLFLACCPANSTIPMILPSDCVRYREKRTKGQKKAPKLLKEWSRGQKCAAACIGKGLAGQPLGFAFIVRDQSASSIRSAISRR